MSVVAKKWTKQQRYTQPTFSLHAIDSEEVNIHSSLARGDMEIPQDIKNKSENKNICCVERKFLYSFTLLSSYSPLEHTRKC